LAVISVGVEEFYGHCVHVVELDLALKAHDFSVVILILLTVSPFVFLFLILSILGHEVLDLERGLNLLPVALLELGQEALFLLFDLLFLLQGDVVA
jgi:hypothetical protein